MDINDLRSLITLVSFISFVGIVVWAWSGQRREAFREASLLALDDDAPTLTFNGKTAK